MCGICGAINHKGHPELSARVLRINQKLRHRGPDGEGYALYNGNQWQYAYGTDTSSEVLKSALPYTPTHNIQELQQLQPIVVFGHRRLSIIDLSPAGHQPLANSNVIIVHNGEIYNYIELRKELEDAGHVFYSHTDTEVIIQAWRAWGEKMLYRFDGMFAFALFDTEQQIFFAARDRTGVKPFYYQQQEDTFSFASEIKALDSTHKVNASAAIDYLIFNKSEAEQESMIKGIHELPPGHSLKFHLQKNKITLQHWQKEEEKKKIWEFDNDKHQVNTFRSLFLNSLHLRMRSDTPIAACVSGGIDSSAIATGLHEQGIHKLSMFTAIFPESKQDEKNWAELIAKQTGYHWQQVFPDANSLMQDFKEFIHCQDLPFFSLSVYSQFYLMKSIQQKGIKVTIDGQGADELLAGYRRHMAAYAVEAMKKGQLNLARKLMHHDSGVREIMMKKAVSALMPAKEMAKRYLQGHPVWEYLHPDHRDEAMQKTTAYFSTSSKGLADDLHKEYFGTPLKVLLRVGDRSSMHHGIESRMPFADDPALMYFSHSLNSEMKINKNMGKWILREAMHGITPEAVLKRKDKTGFATPEIHWLKKSSEELWDGLPGHSNLLQVARIKDKHKLLMQQAEQQHLHKVWRMLNYLWWERVFEISS